MFTADIYPTTGEERKAINGLKELKD